METEDKVEGSQEKLTDQTQDNQGQSKQEGNQPIEVELPDGTRVSIEELKSGYLKDSDYRKKTAEVAAERRRLELERAEQRRYPRAQVNLEPEPDAEEANPIEYLARQVAGMQAYVVRTELTKEIDRLAAKYPDADKRAVFAACWANPHTNIEDELVRSQEIIQAKIAERTPKTQAPASLEEYFKQNPKAKEEYDRKVQEDFMRKKAQKSASAKTVTGGSAGSAETIHKEAEEKPSSYRQVSERLKEKFKEEKDESFD